MTRSHASFARRSGVWRSQATRAVTLLLSAVLTGSASLAHACPNCAVGRATRSRVWSDDFLLYLTLSALPFVLIGALCIGIEVLGRRS